MGLTTLPERVSGSLGETKLDTVARPYSNYILPSGEWNNSAQSITDVCNEVGLENGSTAGSLVARTKEFARWNNQDFSDFTSSNPIPAPIANNGWVNPRLIITDSTSSLYGKALEICADATSNNNPYNTSVWLFDNLVPLQPMNISFNVSLGISQSFPGVNDIALVGIIFASSNSGSVAYIHASGPFTGSWATWTMCTETSPAYLEQYDIGSYFSNTHIQVVGNKLSGSTPSFTTLTDQVDIVGGLRRKLISFAQTNPITSSWISASCNRIGIILIGSASNPITMSMSDIRIFPRPGDAGIRL